MLMEGTLVEMAAWKFYFNFKSGVFVAHMGGSSVVLLFLSVNGCGPSGFLTCRTQLNQLSLWRP